MSTQPDSGGGKKLNWRTVFLVPAMIVTGIVMATACQSADDPQPAEKPDTSQTVEVTQPAEESDHPPTVDEDEWDQPPAAEDPVDEQTVEESESYKPPTAGPGESQTSETPDPPHVTKGPDKEQPTAEGAGASPTAEGPDRPLTVEEWIAAGEQRVKEDKPQRNESGIYVMRSNKDMVYERSLAHFAALDGRLDVLKQLKEQGVDIDEKSSVYDRTPMYYAARGGHLEVMKWLKEQGANVNAVDNDGKTPLSATENEKAKQWLRDNGARE